MAKVEACINALNQRYGLDLADVPEILEDPLWQNLMAEARRVKQMIAETAS
jgi:hypothetical protein